MKLFGSGRYTNTLLFFLVLLLSPVVGHGQSEVDSLLYPLKVGQIYFEGNERTRPSIIRREMAIATGDRFDSLGLAHALEIDQRKIINTNLFVTVDMLTNPGQDSTTIDITVVMKERWYFIFLPIFQLADRNFNEWWYDRNRDIRRTIYGSYFSYGNLTGRADKLKLLAEFGFIPKFDVTYSLPYIDKAQKTGITVGASYSINKTTAYRTWNDKLSYFNSEDINKRRFYTFINLTRRNKFYSYHSLDLRWSNTSISDTIARLNPNYLDRNNNQQRYFQLTYSFAFDKRDNVQYPLRGQSWGVQFSKIGLLPSDQVNTAYLYGSYRKYIPLSPRWFANTGVKARLSFPKSQPYLQRTGLGYRNDLVRGYELYVIDGQDYGLWKNEIKFKLFSWRKQFDWIPIRQFNTIPIAVYLNTFADAGYIRNTKPELSNTQLGNQLLLGTGTGVDIVTFYNIVAKFTYSYNRQREGRFFFNLTRDF
ncbi:BamA/TamA family outer membrane protein [Dyadobacter jejuensis]|uniref:BamA/TamA family outer membrane protein n=1 Tax=Dyadobacter jejuensis TaxID=1082580 RepID=UPI001E3C8D2A|nr:BamA/TamA family outer membrane protein [Dyadobacter jejuensis]